MSWLLNNCYSICIIFRISFFISIGKFSWLLARLTFPGKTGTLDEKQRKRIAYFMNIVSCDDSPEFLKELHAAIEQHCAMKDWAFHCQAFQRPEELLAADLSAVQTLFLDIDMPGINGLETAHRLRERYPELIIVFVTGFIEYAPAGYDVDAFRYLLKSDFEARLPRCLEDIWDKLYVRQESIRLTQAGRSVKMRLKDILYIEGTPQRHVLVHSIAHPGTPLECLGMLADYEEKLSGKGFLRIQKSFLVNMCHIDDIRSYSAILDNGEELKVSRRNYASICKQFLLWEGQNL